MGKYKILSIILVVFLFTRIAILLTCIGCSFQFEQRHMGMIAKEIIEGLDLPLLEYQHTSYGGGTLLEGIATVPFFLIFGKNLFALKLTPLLFSTATLVVLFLFVYKYFNKRTAVIMSLLFTFASPIWINNTLAGQGSHTENILFTVIALFLFYEIIFNQKKRLVYYFWLGFVSGLGTYWVYTFLVTLAAIFIIWLAHDRKLFLRRGFYVFCIGFLIGMLPWFMYNLSSRFNGIRIFSGFFEANYFDRKVLIDVISRFFRNIQFSTMLNFAGLSRFPYSLLGNIYLLMFWSGFFFILRLNKFSIRRILISKESFIIIFPILLIISTSLFRFGNPCDPRDFLSYRYIIGIFPFAYLTIAIVLDSFFLRFRVLKLTFISLFFLFVITAMARYINYINPEDFGSGFRELGYTYTDLSGSFVEKYQNNLYIILDNITRLKPTVRAEVLAQTINLAPIIDNPPFVPPVNFREYVRLSQRLEEKDKPFFYAILTRTMYLNSKLNLEDLVRDIKVLSLYVGQIYRPYFYEGIGDVMVDLYSDNSDAIVKYKKAARLIDKEYLPYYYRGLAYYPGGPIIEHLRRYRKCIGWIPDEYQPFYLKNTGEVLAQRGIDQIMHMADFNNPDEETGRLLYYFLYTLEPGKKKYVLEGIGEYLTYFFTPSNKKEVYKFISCYLRNPQDRIRVREIMCGSVSQKEKDKERKNEEINSLWIK